MSKFAIEVPPLTCAEIISVATDVRQRFGVTGDRYPVVQILEVGMLLLDPEFTFGVKERYLMKDDLGQTVPSENAIYLREDVYKRAANDVYNDRFTVAHELGHHFLHKNVKVTFHQKHHRRKYRPQTDSEWQADIFGAALMMPVRRLIKCRSLDEAAVRFGVPKSKVGSFNRALDRERLMRRLY
ncbi:ImmA/IrrE family metallo-endopeptidase [Pseudomonas sp. SLFW]|uniref:ImmA/IrrE family metallo-endopeptidase n=1 Tax=Pseudomonas sp. SLFW TaxID=2683259 RepID=UPI0014131B15|nr:ImmA/IrrE family metallo-endopeptidase [Pseudomonas sp. SLFW]NBB11836.1 ImmA/IrrE family metallo-endopeptidase [Pseudomonas sp. SLFW]